MLYCSLMNKMCICVWIAVLLKGINTLGHSIDFRTSRGVFFLICDYMPKTDNLTIIGTNMFDALFEYYINSLKGVRTLKSDFKWFSFYYKVLKFEKPQTIMLPMLTLSSFTIISINIREKHFSPLLLYRYVAAVVLPHARYAALSVPPSSPPQALVWCTLCSTSWPAPCHASCCLVRSLTLWERMWVVL